MKKIITLLTVFTLLLCFCCGLTACSAESKLKKAYENVVAKNSGELALVCLELASDGTYVKFDSNPYNEDDYSVTGAWDLLDDFKEELKVPSYIEEEIGKTTWSMGKQTAEFDDYVLTWTYHPDKGLELMCRVK